MRTTRTYWCSCTGARVPCKHTLLLTNVLHSPPHLSLLTFKYRTRRCAHRPRGGGAHAQRQVARLAGRRQRRHCLLGVAHSGTGRPGHPRSKGGFYWHYITSFRSSPVQGGETSESDGREITTFGPPDIQPPAPAVLILSSPAIHRTEPAIRADHCSVPPSPGPALHPSLPCPPSPSALGWTTQSSKSTRYCHITR